MVYPSQLVGDYGEGYALSGPKGVRANIRVSAVWRDVSAFIPRSSFGIEWDAGNLKASVNFEIWMLASEDVYTFKDWQRVLIDDPYEQHLGRNVRFFVGFLSIVGSDVVGPYHVYHMQCVDYNVLLDLPPKQIRSQWPPVNGTPVVNTTGINAVTGSGSPQTVQVRRYQDMYAGRVVTIQNADGSNSEDVTIDSVNSGVNPPTITATINTNKSVFTTQINAAFGVNAGQNVTIPVDDASGIPIGAVIIIDQNTADTTEEVTYVRNKISNNIYCDLAFEHADNAPVKVRWRVIGGITDVQFLKDGWLQDVNGTLTVVRPLVSEFYNDVSGAGYTVGTTAIGGPYITSLPHLKWEGETVRTAITDMIAQNADLTKNPRFYMSALSNVAGDPLANYDPLLRYYDASDSTILTTVEFTDQEIVDPDTQAHVLSYYRELDGSRRFVIQTVLGTNHALGTYENATALSDIGIKTEAPPIKMETVGNNLAALAAAQRVQENFGKRRERISNVQSLALINPYIFFEPHVVSFRHSREAGTPAEYAVTRVKMSFAADGVALYTYELGDAYEELFSRPQPALGSVNLIDIQIPSPPGFDQTGSPPAWLLENLYNRTTQLSSHMIQWTYDVNDADVVYFLVQRRTAGTFWSAAIRVDVPTTSLRFLDLSPSVVQYYRVFAVDNHGNHSLPSIVVSYAAAARYDPPAPTNFANGTTNNSAPYRVGVGIAKFRWVNPGGADAPFQLRIRIYRSDIGIADESGFDTLIPGSNTGCTIRSGMVPGYSYFASIYSRTQYGEESQTPATSAIFTIPEPMSPYLINGDFEDIDEATLADTDAKGWKRTNVNGGIGERILQSSVSIKLGGKYAWKMEVGATGDSTTLESWPIVVINPAGVAAIQKRSSMSSEFFFRTETIGSNATFEVYIDWYKQDNSSAGTTTLFAPGVPATGANTLVGGYSGFYPPTDSAYGRFRAKLTGGAGGGAACTLYMTMVTFQPSLTTGKVAPSLDLQSDVTFDNDGAGTGSLLLTDGTAADFSPNAEPIVFREPGGDIVAEISMNIIAATFAIEAFQRVGIPTDLLLQTYDSSAVIGSTILMAGDGGSISYVADMHSFAGAIGISGDLALSGISSFTKDDAVNSAITDILKLTHNTTGSPAANLGTGILFRGETSTTEDMDMGRIAFQWTTITHASRAAKISFQTVTSGGAITERMSLSALGNLSVLGTGTHAFSGPLTADQATFSANGGAVGLTVNTPASHSVDYVEIKENGTTFLQITTDKYLQRIGDAFIIDMISDTEGAARITLRNNVDDQGARLDVYPDNDDGSRAYVDYVFGYDDGTLAGDSKIRWGEVSLLTTSAHEWQFMGLGGSPALLAIADMGLWIADTAGAPGSNPSGGGYLYVQSGALKYRGSGGTVTTVANA